MHSGTRIWRSAAAAALLATAALTLAACGSSSSSSGSGNAQTLLKQTFARPHKVNSGVLSFSLSLDPVGLEHAQGPDLAQPERSVPEPRHAASCPSRTSRQRQRARPSRPARDRLHRHQRLRHPPGRRLPAAAADFQKLDSSFASATPGAAGGRALEARDQPPALAHQPDRRRSGHRRRRRDHPHPRPRQRRRAARTTSTPSCRRRPPARRQPRARSRPRSRRRPVRRSPRDQEPDRRHLDGTSDKTLRKLAINLNVPVSGQISTLLGGLSSAGIGLTLAVRRPQPAADDLRARQRAAVHASSPPSSRASCSRSRARSAAWGRPRRGAGSSSSGSGTTGAGSVNPDQRPEVHQVHPAGRGRRDQDAEVRVAAERRLAATSSHRASSPRGPAVPATPGRARAPRRARPGRRRPRERRRPGGSGPGRAPAARRARCSSTGVSSEIRTQSAPSNSSMLKISVSSSGESSTTSRTSVCGLK